MYAKIQRSMILYDIFHGFIFAKSVLVTSSLSQHVEVFRSLNCITFILQMTNSE